MMHPSQIELSNTACAEFKGLVSCLCAGESPEADMAVFDQMPRPSDVPDFTEALQTEDGWRLYVLMVAESAVKLLKERIG